MGYLTQITNENFQSEVIESDVPVIVDFWAPWCMPCKMIAPTLEEIAREYEDKVKVVKLNTDEQPDIASQFSVTSIPTLIFFNNGEVVNKNIGNSAKARLIQMIKENFNL